MLKANLTKGAESISTISAARSGAPSAWPEVAMAQLEGLCRTPYTQKEGEH